MKKWISLFISLCLMLCAVAPVSAAGASLSLSGVPAEQKVGATATVTVNLSGTPTVSSVLVQIALGNGLELVEGKWVKTGLITDFNAAEKEGVMALATPGTLDGAVFTFTVRAKAAAATAQSLSVTVTLKSGSATVGTPSGQKSVHVVCAAHSFGAYVKVNDNQHKHTCATCGHVETGNHTWNGGAVVKAATCKDTGTKEYTCTACGAKKQETVAKTDHHTWGGYTVTKQPTCTAAGVQTRTCAVCGKTESQTVNATGHTFGAWAQSKAPTCTEKGEEKRSCGKCGHSETRAVNALGHNFSHPTVTKEPTCTETGVESGKCSRCGQMTTNTIKAKGHKFGAWADGKAATCTAGGTQERKCTVCDATESRDTKALGHDFENPTIVKEATISSTGLKEGKCKRCGETTKEIIPCSFKDETTGVQFEASEGAFAAGTELKVEEITGDNPTFASAENVLKDACGEFRLYTVAATANNAAVQPTGAVMVTLPVPDGFGKDVAVFCLASDGTYTKAESSLSADGKTVSVSVTALGSFAVGKQDAQTENGDNNTDVNGNVDTPDDGAASQKSGTVTYIILAVAALLVIGGVVAWIVIKKKKTA